MTGKYVVLKDQYIVTTDEIYEKLNEYEKAMQEKKSFRDMDMAKVFKLGQ